MFSVSVCPAGRWFWWNRFSVCQVWLWRRRSAPPASLASLRRRTPPVSIVVFLKLVLSVLFSSGMSIDAELFLCLYWKQGDKREAVKLQEVKQEEEPLLRYALLTPDCRSISSTSWQSRFTASSARLQ